MSDHDLFRRPPRYLPSTPAVYRAAVRTVLPATVADTVNTHLGEWVYDPNARRYDRGWDYPQAPNSVATCWLDLTLVLQWRSRYPGLFDLYTDEQLDRFAAAWAALPISLPKLFRLEIVEPEIVAGAVTGIPPHLFSRSEFTDLIGFYQFFLTDLLCAGPLDPVTAHEVTDTLATERFDIYVAPAYLNPTHCDDDEHWWIFL